MFNGIVVILQQTNEFTGMVYTSPESPWIKTLKPFLEKKKALQADAWGYHPSEEVDGLFQVILIQSKHKI